MEKSSRKLGQVIYHCWKQLPKNGWNRRISVTFCEFPTQDKTVLLSLLLFLHLWFYLCEFYLLQSIKATEDPKSIMEKYKSLTKNGQ